MDFMVKAGGGESSGAKVPHEMRPFIGLVSAHVLCSGCQ